MEKNKIDAYSPTRRLKKHLTSGNLWLYILSLIKREKKLYAYALDSAIKKKFGFETSKVMIYLVLYRLESEGLIQSKFENRRKYYTLTKKGIEILEIGKKYLSNLSKVL
ncbi:MAG: helix-turn-helix transcriptional regulator [Candidatus Micrarchaeia archaeon]